MKIGIVTQPLHRNFGGILQNYALQIVLRRIGHDPITYNQVCPEISNTKLRLANLKTFLLKLVGKSAGRSYEQIHSSYIKSLLKYYPQSFVRKYITTTSAFDPRTDFENIFKKYPVDAFVVGSDQVWRPKYVSNLQAQFLNFVKDSYVLKIAYAASFGTDRWEYSSEQTDMCSELARQFNCISVRENSAISLCKSHLGVDASLVLDPTLLLSPEDYISLIEEESEPMPPGDLFCYILDDSQEKQAFIQTIGSKYALTPFYVRIGDSISKVSDKDIVNNIQRYQTPSITSWLKGIYSSKMVVADSFHAIAFAIIFNKPFYVIGNKERGYTRFQSLLEIFNLENRLIDELYLERIDVVESDIDWESVNHIRDSWRKKSIKLLIDQLKG